MIKMSTLKVGICLLLGLNYVNSQSISVTHDVLATLYLPYTYTPDAQFAIQKDAAEQMSYDPSAKILYSVGFTNIHVIDLSDPNSPAVLHYVSYSNVDVTDVEVCGGYVFVSFDNETRREDGIVNVYRKYNRATDTLELVNTIYVGTLPDMVAPTSDCSKVLVAVEAEPYAVNMTLVDNAGGVGVISFSNGADGAYTYKLVDFTKFDAQYSILKNSGLRHVYPNGTFSADVEPEYIAYNEDETKAYICLQENNAIAVFDMATEQIENIYGLGFKDWSQLTIDVSDRDSGINMRPWPVFGMYQPDAIKVITYNGVDYVISANEGDSKDYGDIFSEESRVKDMPLSTNFGNADAIAELKTDGKLGRLKVTTVNGLNETTNSYDKLYTFGGRGISIRRADTMELVYDSGNEIGRKTALLTDYIFNSNVDAEDTITSSFDGRSDDKGAETESLAVGKVFNTYLLFVGNERPGTIAIYSINGKTGSPTPVFIYLITGIPSTAAGKWSDLFNDRTVSMLDPEDIHFVSAEDSPNGKPMLLVSGSVSGTISVVQLSITLEQEDPSGVGFNTLNLGLAVICQLLAVSKMIGQ